MVEARVEPGPGSGDSVGAWNHASGSADVIVVGAGIAGLVTAWEASRRGLGVALVEAGSRAGGKVDEVEIAGRVVETGPDAFLARVPWAVDLCADLGIDGELVPPGTGHAWLWTRGRLRRLPEGLVLGAPSRLAPLARSRVLSVRGLARAALDELWSRPQADGDRSVTDAIGAHLGQEVVDRLVDPLLGGIYAGHCDRVSIRASAPQLDDPSRAPRLMRALRAQTAAPVPAGAGREANNTGVRTHDGNSPVFLTPRGGMGTVVQKLVEQLPPGTLRLGTQAAALRREGGHWRIGDVRAARVVLATPAFTSAALVRPHSPALADRLASIRYASVAVALLAYRRDQITLPEGSGLLVPRVDGRLMTAASWWDQKWPHRADAGSVVVRASAGRVGDERAMQMADDDLASRLHDELAAAVRTVPGASVRSTPLAMHVARWPQAFPQYDVGHLEAVAAIEATAAAELSTLHLTGAAFKGVGIPACVREARAVAARLAEAAAVRG